MIAVEAHAPLVRFVFRERVAQLPVGGSGRRELLEHRLVVVAPLRGLRICGAEHADRLPGTCADGDSEQRSDAEVAAGEFLWCAVRVAGIAEDDGPFADPLSNAGAPEGAGVMRYPLRKPGASPERAPVVAGEDDEGEGGAYGGSSERDQPLHGGSEWSVDGKGRALVGRWGVLLRQLRRGS